jgi:hypothetical protein
LTATAEELAVSEFRFPEPRLRSGLFSTPASTGLRQSEPVALAKAHHPVPAFYLSGFAGPSGKPTVIRLHPKPRLLGEQRPEKIGVVTHLNSWLRADGTRDDVLEQGPAARLDDIGAAALRRLSAFADAIEPEGALRLLGWEVDERVPLYLLVAGLMVRGLAFRKAVDATALPTLLDEMLGRLDAGLASGETDPGITEVIRTALSTPGQVHLKEPENRHQHALVPFLESVTAALGSTFVIAVRRLPLPMLSGSESALLFGSSHFADFRSFAELVATEQTIRLWDEQPDQAERTIEAVSKITAILVPVDARTVMLLFDPDKGESARFVFMASQVDGKALAGLVSVGIAANSEWVAGPPDCELLGILKRLASDAEGHDQAAGGGP